MLNSSAQHISCKVTKLDTSEIFLVSFVYGLHTYIDRRRLGEELSSFKFFVDAQDLPWCVMGDFNAILSLNEAEGGNLKWDSSLMDFNDFVHSVGLTDLRSCGSYYTWWDKSLTTPKFRKIDRVMVNDGWLSFFPSSLANFMARGVSYHDPAAVFLGNPCPKIKKPFQLFDHFIAHPQFLSLVREAWANNIIGDPWWILTNKLKKVKSSMMSLNNMVGNLHFKVNETRGKLTLFQECLPVSPAFDQLTEEVKLVKAYNNALKEEEIILSQKSRIRWLKKGMAIIGTFIITVEGDGTLIKSWLLRMIMVLFANPIRIFLLLLLIFSGIRWVVLPKLICFLMILCCLAYLRNNQQV